MGRTVSILGPETSLSSNGPRRRTLSLLPPRVGILSLRPNGEVHHSFFGK